MYTIHEADLVTLTGHMLPSLADAAREEAAAQGEADVATLEAVSDPTPDRLSRLQAATARHVAAARMLGLCAARLMRATAR